MAKPNCHNCVHRLEVPGDAHSRCNNHAAKVKGDPHGIKMGWFFWPVNFDPVWLEECDGFSDKPEDKKPLEPINPMMELASFFRMR